MRYAIPSLLLLLSGCAVGLTSFTKPDDIGDDGGGNGGGDADADVDTDDWDSDPLDTDGGSSSGGGSGGGSLSIDDVDPWWGVSDGGLAVTVSGSGFGSSTEVLFGGNDATVATRGSSALTVETPAVTGISETAGFKQFDVIVKDDSGSDTLADGFTYYLSGVDKAGAVGAISWYHWTQSAKSGPFDTSTMTDSGDALIYVLTAPRDVHWWEFYSPTADTCVDDSYSITDSVDFNLTDLGATSLTLAPATGTAATLVYDSDYGGFLNPALTSGQVPEGTLYDLGTVAAGYAPEDFSVSDFAKSGSSMTISSPNLNASMMPMVSQSSMNLSWTSSGSGKVLVALALLNSSGSTLDEIWCVANDDGSFSVPSSSWSTTWSRGNFLFIQMGKAVENGGTLPYNNGEVRVSGIYWHIGIGTVN